MVSKKGLKTNMGGDKRPELVAVKKHCQSGYGEQRQRYRQYDRYKPPAYPGSRFPHLIGRV